MFTDYNSIIFFTISIISDYPLFDCQVRLQLFDKLSYWFLTITNSTIDRIISTTINILKILFKFTIEFGGSGFNIRALSIPLFFNISLKLCDIFTSPITFVPSTDLNKLSSYISSSITFISSSSYSLKSSTGFIPSY